jgi:glutamate-ammonia-ligase adenylyltransferase
MQRIEKYSEWRPENQLRLELVMTFWRLEIPPIFRKIEAMIDREYLTDLFREPRQAGKNLLTLQEAFIRSGSRFPIEQFAESLRQQLLSSPDPGMALTNLVRFSETAVSKTTLFNDLIQYPVALEVLMKIFAFSQYFADILVREPGLFQWLTTSDVLIIPVSRQYLEAEVDRLRTTFENPDRLLEALKRIHRREMLRIGAQDLLGNADLSSLTAQLSDLADIIVSAVHEVSVQQLAQKFGGGPGMPFAVIGLGKLGGGELNYSSDIDVVFVYAKEGEFRTPGGVEVSCHEYFVRLSEKIVQNLSQATAGGHLYRVDTRLRPDSGAGPLARSARGYAAYYESRGELWERQMLMKARPIAGDLVFGSAFLRELDPFVYPRTLLQHPSEYIARIKGRIEAAVGDEANVKLMSGGIRDIEFVVQALQLLYAGKQKVLREHNTLRALAALAAAGLLTPEEASMLHEGYVFHRTLEHRLQTLFNTQTHVIPEDDAMRTSLAKRMGFGDAADLVAQSAMHRRGVRAIFDRIMATPDDGGGVKQNKGEGIIAVLEGVLPEAAVRAVLSQYGFNDVSLATRHLRTLATGSALTGLRELDSRARDALRGVAPTLFTDIAGTPVPEMTLANIVLVAAAQKFPDQFYSLLQQDGFRKFLLQVCAASPRFARGLARDPLLLESFAADAEALSEPGVLSPPAATDAIAHKQHHELRIGIRHVLGLSDFDAMTGDLTRLADGIVAAIVREESLRAALRGDALGVFALGKFGTGEITFDADLDLLFVVDTPKPAVKSMLEKVAARIVARLGAASDTGRLYEIDARLRPEGKNAPLVVDANSYLLYLSSRASLWERQSLTRLRPVIGETAFVQGLKAKVEDFVYGKPLPSGWIEETVKMRRRTESRSRVRRAEFIDIKLGPGGMGDVEFLVQIMQLHTRRTDLRGRKVSALLAADDLPWLDPQDALTLLGAYRLLRRVETHLRITLEERGSVLPERDNLERLARCLAYPDGEAMARDLDATMQRVRSIFLTTCSALSRR